MQKNGLAFAGLAIRRSWQWCKCMGIGASCINIDNMTPVYGCSSTSYLSVTKVRNQPAMRRTPLAKGVLAF